MASPRICSVEACGNRHFGKTYCVRHYKRWRKYGDPLGGGTDQGAAQRFIAEAVSSENDECITYPFYRKPDGYGWMHTPLGRLGAHVYVATIVHGEKPTPKHEACHSCGNGHLGCVNHRHIYWGTKSDNMRDSLAHGTGRRFQYVYGEGAPAAKYSDAFIQQVRDALARGDRQMAISKHFNISQSHVSRIKNGARK